MALDNYTDLKSAVADWLDREDLTARVPDFVLMAESMINRDLRVADMEKTATAYLTDGAVALPADFNEPRRILSNATGAYQIALEPLSPTEAGNLYPSSQSGVPVHYTISGNTLATYPGGGTSQVTMIYYAKLPTLLAYGTNWLLTKAPDIYLYGSLLHSGPYLGDDGRATTWAQLYQAALEKLQAADQRSRYASSVCRVPGVNP
jgi:hypothetical protein